MPPNVDVSIIVRLRVLQVYHFDNTDKFQYASHVTKSHATADGVDPFLVIITKFLKDEDKSDFHLNIMTVVTQFQ
jgi:hypothetical protein